MPSVKKDLDDLSVLCGKAMEIIYTCHSQAQYDQAVKIKGNKKKYRLITPRLSPSVNPIIDEALQFV